MDYNYEKYEGLFIPTVTPFDPSGDLDLKSLDKVARYQASIPGVAALVSCARIGEGTVLTPDEKIESRGRQPTSMLSSTSPLFASTTVTVWSLSLVT